jgi:hypothetical protein
MDQKLLNARDRRNARDRKLQTVLKADCQVCLRQWTHPSEFCTA